MAAGKKVLMVIASSQFRDEEYQRPRALLEAAGAEITVASSSLSESVGMLGMRVTPDILIKDAKMQGYDALLLVGGMGSTEYWESAEAHALARSSFAANKPTAAICLAPMTLANAGLLKGKQATIWKDAADDFQAKGVHYTSQDVVRDGLIITGSGPDAAEAFGRVLVEALQ